MLLQYLLVRPTERVPVEQAARGLRFVVLEELHAYRGRQGADASMLGVCVFVDGPDHDAPAQTESDLTKRGDLADLGFRVVVIRTDEDLAKQTAGFPEIFGKGVQGPGS